jgi:hypothetical protein
MYYPLDNITQCERGLWNGLKALNADLIRSKMAPYLSRSEIEALIKRHEKMKKHFQELIDKKGEHLVIYDVAQPSTQAPWGDD